MNNTSTSDIIGLVSTKAQNIEGLARELSTQMRVVDDLKVSFDVETAERINGSLFDVIDDMYFCQEQLLKSIKDIEETLRSKPSQLPP